MAITSTICTSFKQEILVEGHNLTQGADSIKLALYTSSATLGKHDCPEEAVIEGF